MMGTVRGGIPALGMVAVVALAGWWATPGRAESPAARIAFVDVQRVLARSQAGVAAREALEREKAVMQKQVDQQRDEIKKLQEDLDKKGQLLAAEARRERQEALERKVRDVRRLVDDLQKELQKKEQELLAKVLNDVSGVVQKVGKDKGYLLIVEKRGAAVVYGAAEADLTDEIVRAFDDETKKAKK